MDHILAMSLAILGMLGFLLWCFRPTAPLLVRLAITAVAVGWLSVYLAVALFRSQPEVWGGAEMNQWTLLIIAAGVYALISKPNKPNRDGGERSA